MTAGTGRYFIETWGCQMNQLDTLRLSGQLHQQGMVAVEDPGEADLILLNSCSVREKAEQKAYSRLGEYRQLKSVNPELKIGFCGCVAQQEGERALKRVPDLDFVLGTGRVNELGRVVQRCRTAGERIVAVGFPTDRHYDIDSISRKDQYKGMVTIIEGCNKRCTFCIVPTTRGPEHCRDLTEILAEIRGLIERGFIEIELLGQTVNHWTGCDETGTAIDFSHLLDAVARIPGVRRLRFVTSYPRDFTQSMVDQFRHHQNLSSYLHLPVQSGSNRVLRRMGRGYEIESYCDLVARLREARHDLNLTTDIIVGFPGETEDEFRQTLDLVRRIRFGAVYAFKYSPRPGTAALRLSDSAVPDEVADRRLQDLFRLQSEIQSEINSRLLGQQVEVLITGRSRQADYLSGRTGCNRVVHFEASPETTPLGSLSLIEVTRANPFSLVGRIAS